MFEEAKSLYFGSPDRNTLEDIIVVIIYYNACCHLSIRLEAAWG